MQNIVRKFIEVVIAAICAVQLVACTTNSPDSALREFYVALSQGDTGTMRRSLCERERETFDHVGGSVAMGLLSQFTRPDVSGLRYMVREQSQERALVEVSGEAGIEVLGVRSYVPIKGTITMVMEDGAWKVCGGQ